MSKIYIVLMLITDFLSDPTLSKIQAGISDTNLILILGANTPNVSGKSILEEYNECITGS